KKKNTRKKVDVEVHRVSVAEPTSEKNKENLDIKGLMLQKAILVCLLDDFSKKKASKALGYLLSMTTLDKISEGEFIGYLVTDNHALFFSSIREVTTYVSLHAELDSYVEETSMGPRAPQQQQT
nr:DNA-directed RNA polymerase V subunit 7-like [Tanacetum cinerariifolium]